MLSPLYPKLCAVCINSLGEVIASINLKLLNSYHDLSVRNKNDYGGQLIYHSYTSGITLLFILNYFIFSKQFFNFLFRIVYEWNDMQRYIVTFSISHLNEVSFSTF